MRGNKGDGYELQAGSVNVKGSELTAKVKNSLRAGVLELKLTAYDGFIRLFIDEATEERRFQVRCRDQQLGCRADPIPKLNPLGHQMS